MLHLAEKLSGASNSIWSNVPAAALILSVLMLCSSGPAHSKAQAKPRLARQSVPSECGSVIGRMQQQASPAEDRDAWKNKVQSKVVQYAWEKLSSSLVQQWIYGTWYAALTPDKEFPAEVRNMLNTAFGEICSRAQRVDFKTLFLRDICQVLSANIELFRATQAAVGPAQLATLIPAARERALQREMRAMGNLHVAMCTPEGHYKFLTALAEGLLQHLLPGSHGQILGLRIGVVLRELVASCGLRPVMMFCLPHNINKLLYTALQSDSPPSRDPAVERLLVEAAQRWELLGQGSLRAEADALPGLAADVGQRLRSGTGASVLDVMQQRAVPRRPSVDGSEPQSSHLSALKPSASAVSLGANFLAAGMSQAATAPAADAAPAPWQSSQRSAHWTGGSPLRGTAQAPLPPAPRSAKHTTTGHRTTRSDVSEIAMQLDAGTSAVQVITAAAVESELRQGSNHRLHEQQRHSTLQSCATSLAGLSASWHSAQPAHTSSPGDGTAHQHLASSWHANDDHCSTIGEAAGDGGSFTSEAAPLLSRGAGVSSAGGAAGITAAIERHGFVGYPRASVVAPETHVECGFAGALREYVSYKIRVTDGAGEWTVTRRFKNFEALHVVLQSRSPLYRQLRLSPPTKGLFLLNQDGAFVHQRRKELDVYLRTLLSHPNIALCDELWQFLCPGSTTYYNYSHNPLEQLFGNNSLPTDSQMRGGEAPASTPDVTPTAATARHRRLGSGASDDFILVRQHPVATSLAGTAPGGPPCDLLAGLPAPGNATAAAGAVAAAGAAMPPRPQQRSRAYSDTGGSQTAQPSVASPPGSSLDEGVAPDISTAAGAAGLRDQEPPSITAPASTTEAGQPLQASTVSSPSISARPMPAGTAAAPLSPSGSMAGSPDSAKADATVAPAHGDGGEGSFVMPPRRSSGSSFSPHSTLEEQQAQYSEALGAGDPLLDLVDTVFQLQGRGFLWRQASSLARQTLSLLAGDAIDRFLINQLKALTSELKLARMILALQSALWPGGVWFAWFNQQQQQRAEASKRQQPGSLPPQQDAEAVSEPWIPTWAPAPPMRPERFLEPAVRPPDEAEMAKKVLERLHSKAPNTLVRILGQRNYSNSITELHSMLQSPTFTLQIGYDILEAVVTSAFPELGYLFRQCNS